MIVLLAPPLHASELIKVIEKLKPSIVGVGTFKQTRSPPINFLGTGFAVGDGRHVITNAHVVQTLLETEKKESLIVMVGQGKEGQAREAKRVAVDPDHDLALLQISGEALQALQLGDSDTVREGQAVVFTGFPIGMVLGLYPVTHRGIVSALTPIVQPGLSSKQLDEKMIKRLRDSAYTVFQLDATAYPGNSGSPLYDPETGTVYGIINMVFVKGTKETALTQPSGITYAIPGKYLQDLLRKQQALE
ncbi:MAG: serine protease [Gammaproteobacteria bacterium]